MVFVDTPKTWNWILYYDLIMFVHKREKKSFNYEKINTHQIKFEINYLTMGTSKSINKKKKSHISSYMCHFY